MHKYIFSIIILTMLSSCSTKKVATASDHDSYQESLSHHRAEYKADFLKDERSPLREPDFKYMHFFEADETYNCDCEFSLTPDAKPFEMPTVSGKTKIFTKYGTADCPINNKTVPVHIYRSYSTTNIPGYADYLFIPFKDHTSGESTYGAGRYIDIKTGDIQNGRVAIDFNKCYNPWCMYSDGYNCPIPPQENHLSVEINAGEKTWTGVKKH